MIHGVTVTLLNAAVTGQDDLGNDIYGFTASTVTGCAYVPGSTSEATQGTEQVIFDADIYMPAGTVVNALDQVLCNGVLYEVQGTPGAWNSPWSGIAGPVKCPLRIVTGATAHAVSGNG